MKHIAAFLVVLTMTACGRPNANIKVEGQSITIDVQDLGEYPQDITRIRLTDTARKEVVWEVRGTDGPQLGIIRLTIGINSSQPTDIRHGSYESVTPAGGRDFVVLPGTRYRIELWTGGTNFGASRSEEFVTLTTNEVESPKR